MLFAGKCLVMNTHLLICRCRRSMVSCANAPSLDGAKTFPPIVGKQKKPREEETDMFNKFMWNRIFKNNYLLNQNKTKTAWIGLLKLYF